MGGLTVKFENGVYLDVTGKGVVVIWGGIFVAALVLIV